MTRGTTTIAASFCRNSPSYFTRLTVTTEFPDTFYVKVIGYFLQPYKATNQKANSVVCIWRIFIYLETKHGNILTE